MRVALYVLGIVAAWVLGLYSSYRRHEAMRELYREAYRASRRRKK